MTTLQLQKAYDLNFVRQEAEGLANSLELIFGVKSAVQRPGERVTAYEIRVLTQELDDALSGFMAMSGACPSCRRNSSSRASPLASLPSAAVTT